MRPTYEELNELYTEQHLSIREIAPKFGVVYQTVHRWMHELEIPFRSQSDGQRLRRRRDSIYYMDESILDSWNPVSAWLMGLMFADGHIAPDRSRAAITSANPDFLIQIRDLLQSNFLIQTKATTPQLYINRMDRVEKLEKFGLTVSKTHTCKFPDVPCDYLPHFVRGFTDGDGWISLRKVSQKNPTPLSGLTVGWEISSSEFASALYNIIQSVPDVTHASMQIRDRREDVRTGGKYSNIHSTHIISAIRTYCHSALALANWLYKDSTPETRLARKYDKYMQVLNSI